MGPVDASQPAPLKVLWLIKGLGPGGAERLLVSTARVTDRTAVAYSVAYVRPDKDLLVADLENEGVVATCLAPSPGSPHVWPLRLRSVLLQDRYDVVHAHSPLMAAVARLLVRSLPRPHRPVIVSTEHNEWPSFSLPTRLLNAVTAPLDQHRWAVSERVRRSMWPGLRGCEVLVHGLVLDERDPSVPSRAELRTRLEIPDEAVVCCTVANLRREKDYPTLLRAARRVIDVDQSLVWLAIGQGPLEADTLAMHAVLGLGERFRLLGYRADVPDLLSAADLFVLSSAHEGLPVSLMEALAAGLPVVATDVGGVSETVTPGVEGLLVPARDPEALASAVLRLVGDPDLRRRMSARARAASARFDIRTAAERQRAVYDRLRSRAS